MHHQSKLQIILDRKSVSLRSSRYRRTSCPGVSREFGDLVIDSLGLARRVERPWSKAVIGHAGFATWVDRFSFSLLFSRNNRFEWMEPLHSTAESWTVVDFWAKPREEKAASFVDRVRPTTWRASWKRDDFLFFSSRQFEGFIERFFFRDSRQKTRERMGRISVNGSELSGSQNDRWWKLITSIYRDSDKGDRNERNSFRSRPRQPFRHSLFLVRFRSTSTRSCV